MKLYTALVELLEAKAEYIREDTATLQLGKFAEGYRAAQEDCDNGFEIVYSDETDED